MKVILFLLLFDSNICLADTWFKVSVMDLTNEMIEKSSSSNPFDLVRSLDGKKVLIEFTSKDIPVSLLKLGSLPLTPTEAKTIKNGIDWTNGDLKPVIIRTIPETSNEKTSSFKGTGKSAVITKTTTQNIDVQAPFDIYFNGVQIILKDHVFGDSAKLQIVAADGVTVVNEFATNWFFASDKQDQGSFILKNKSRVPKNFFFRVKYNSIGTVNNVSAKFNFYFRKIL